MIKKFRKRDDYLCLTLKSKITCIIAFKFNEVKKKRDGYFYSTIKSKIVIVFNKK